MLGRTSEERERTEHLRLRKPWTRHPATVYASVYEEHLRSPVRESKGLFDWLAWRGARTFRSFRFPQMPKEYEEEVVFPVLKIVTSCRSPEVIAPNST